MVVRDDLGLSEAGQALLARLEFQLLERKRGSSWPGTTLIGHEATILRFALGEGVLDELAAAAGGLFRWQQPTLPEDLAFIRSDGTAILSSICHEHDAYLELSDDEYHSLIGALPDVAGLLHSHSES